jgi:hypothetical protein
MIRRDATDYDYIDKLTDKEKEFLNTFSEEFIGAKFNHGKPILNKKDKHKKSCYSNNNARNRCVYSKAIAQNLISDDYTMPEVDYEIQKDSYEDYLIELMDAKKSGRKIDEGSDD